jgi:hypothetical protein
VTIEIILKSIEQGLRDLDKRLGKLESRLDNVGREVFDLRLQAAVNGDRVLGIDQRLVRAELQFDHLENRQHQINDQRLLSEASLIASLRGRVRAKTLSEFFK